MNWLAHIFISKNCIDYQLGNLLADPMKGRGWDGVSRQLEDGFKMHHIIDAFTDSNSFVSTSKARLGARGYLKGVIIDIAYDYLLINNWNRYSKVNFECFIDAFYQNANTAIAAYPDNAREFVTRLIDYKVLSSYGSFDGLETAFQRIDRRLSKRLLQKESAAGYLPILKTEMIHIEKDFLHFFPQLVACFKSQAGGPLHDHWLR